MIALFSIIAILTLLLIFMFVKNQQHYKAIEDLRNQLKRSTRHLNNVALSTNVLTAGTQTNLLKRLNAAHKRGFVSEQDASVLNHIFLEFETIVARCLEKGFTLEEAIKEMLQGQELTLQEVKDTIKKFPKEVRLAWSKNTVDGFILATQNISEQLMPTEIKPAQNESSTDQE